MKEHAHNEHCSRCGKKVSLNEQLASQSRNLVSFFCAMCLTLILLVEGGFANIANADTAINNFSTDALDYISMTSTAATVTPLDIMIDFTNIQKIEHPKSIQENNKQSSD